MMRSNSWLMTVALLLAVSPVCAQEEKTPDTFVYSTYYQCEATRLDEIDELVGEMATIYDQATASGEISGWGWLRHDMGGEWRRAFYAVGSDPAALMDTLDALGDKTGEIEGSDQFSAICDEHVDYMWRMASSSPQSAAAAPGSVGVSVYYKCDFNRESFADSIVEHHVAEILNAHLGEGGLVSWSWLQHQIGGEFRRLLAMRGSDRTSLLTAWGAIVGQLQEKHGDAMREFNDICFTHEDYIWRSGS